MLNRMNRSISYSSSILHFIRLSSSVGNQVTIRRCFTFLTKPVKLCHKQTSSTSYLFNYGCNFSNSNYRSSERNGPDTKVFDDEEFQNILKDFSKDFGLDNESEDLLNDLRKSLDEPEDNKPSSSNGATEVKGALSHNFKNFEDSDSVVIQSYEDLVSGASEDSDTFFHIDQSRTPTLPLEVKRGITGVFDIDDLVDVLRNEKLMDIAVISIPKENHYADYLVLATANSPRHSKAVAEYMNKLYKMKKDKKDPFIIIEGEKVSNWKVLDMGNIVLHIFLEETRDFYDIESLWLVDSEFDSGGTLKLDPVFDALQEQMSFFNALENESSKGTGRDCIKDTT